jgi:hypothetical protein
MYLPPGNIDELLNAPDYVLPALRGRQIAKLISQGVATSAEIYKAQETIAALEQELRDEAQCYDDNLVLVFNVGHTAGYNQGHKAGWKEAVASNREYGFKLGYVEAAKDLIMVPSRLTSELRFYDGMPSSLFPFMFCLILRQRTRLFCTRQISHLG